MQITKDDLRKTYRNLSNDEIERLIFHETSFTSDAIDILKEEVHRRRLPRSWTEQVDEKGGASYLGGRGRSTNYVDTPQEPLSVSKVIAILLGASLPTLSEIAFIVIWISLCYVIYLLVDFFFFS